MQTNTNIDDINSSYKEFIEHRPHCWQWEKIKENNLFRPYRRTLT